MSKKSTMFGHLLELRDRLLRVVIAFVVAFIIAYIFKAEIYSFLVQPLADAHGGAERRMIFTGLTEAFFTYINLSIFSAFVITFPFMALQGYQFLAPGLYKREKGFLYPFVFISPVLFLLGAALVYFFIMPLALNFFLSFESGAGTTELPIQLEAKISEYLSFVTHMIIGFGLAFQLPVVLIMLAKTGLIKEGFLEKNRRYAVIIIFICAAILTPPDIISQLGLAVILVGLYELSILGIRRSQRS